MPKSVLELIHLCPGDNVSALQMILSSRIDYHLASKDGDGAISVAAFDGLIADLLDWRRLTANTTEPSGAEQVLAKNEHVAQMVRDVLEEGQYDQLAH